MISEPVYKYQMSLFADENNSFTFNFDIIFRDSNSNKNEIAFVILNAIISNICFDYFCNNFREFLNHFDLYFDSTYDDRFPLVYTKNEFTGSDRLLQFEYYTSTIKNGKIHDSLSNIIYKISYKKTPILYTVQYNTFKRLMKFSINDFSNTNEITIESSKIIIKFNADDYLRLIQYIELIKQKGAI